MLTAVKDAVGADAPFGIRISQTKVNDLSHEWPGGTRDAEVIFGTLGGVGPSYIHVNAHNGFEEVFGSGESLAGLARKSAGVSIVACGKLNDPNNAERLLAAGTIDLAAMAKGALADPTWPRKIAAGEVPEAFNPEMLRPYATLDNVAAWRGATGHLLNRHKSPPA